MKKILVLALILTMAVGTIAASAQGFVPPGQAKKGITEARWMELMQMREAQDDDNDGSEEMYGPFRMLPPGLQNKGTPPGLLKRGLGLPPGQQKRVGQGEEMPPGIQMRFMENWQFRYEWNVDVEKEDIGWAATEKDLIDLIEEDNIVVIILTKNIALTDTLNIDINRELWIDGGIQKRRLMLDVNNKSFNENMEWMIKVSGDTEFTMRRVVLDGMIEEADDEILEGLVRVEKDAKLTAYGNDLRNAVIGFGVNVDEGDYNEGDEEFLLEDNLFYNVEEPVVFFEGEVVLYPVED